MDLDLIYIEIERERTTDPSKLPSVSMTLPREGKQDVLFIAEKAGYFQASRPCSPSPVTHCLSNISGSWEQILQQRGAYTVKLKTQNVTEILYLYL